VLAQESPDDDARMGMFSLRRGSVKEVKMFTARIAQIR